MAFGWGTVGTIGGLVFGALKWLPKGWRLLSGLGTKGWLVLGGVAIFAAGGWFLYHTFEREQERNEELNRRLGRQEAHNRTLNAQIQQWQDRQLQYEADLAELRRTQEQAKKELRRLDGLFAQHDLGRLAREKPGLIERRVNSGTADAFRLLECATGASSACPDTAE